jgi:[acyl-carrier-protein] S-malonyltransferase
MKTAFLFVGQGSQMVGMGHDVYENYQSSKELFDSVNLDFNVKEVCFNGPKEVLDQTYYTQPSLLITSLAIAKALNEEGIHADVVAGLSLGEYSALCYANGLDVNQAVQLVSKRAEIMSNALPLNVSGMAAVLSDNLGLIQKVVADVKNDRVGLIEIANYNSPSQTVISGENKAIEEAIKRLKELKIRCIPLAVSGAFHTSLLNEASIQLAHELENYTFNQLDCSMLFNISGLEEVDIKQALTKQICSSVQWVNTILRMNELGVECFIEVGPKNSLQKLVKQILPDARVFSVDSKESIQLLKGEFNG